MGLSIFTRGDSARKVESEKVVNGATIEAIIENEAPTRNSTSGDSNTGSPVTSANPKRASRFRMGSMKQLALATKAEIRANVRNDWDWPLPEVPDPEVAEADGEENSGTRRPWTDRVDADTPYVERTPGSEESDDMSDEDEDLAHIRYPRVRNDTHSGRGTKLLHGSFGGMTKARRVHGHNKAVFWDPKRERAALARKERRRRRLREELDWNDGLQVFEARRNAWTSSVLRPAHQTAESVETDGEATNGSSNLEAVPETATTEEASKNEDGVNDNAIENTGDGQLRADSDADADPGTPTTDGNTEAETGTASSVTTAVERLSSIEQDLIPFIPIPAPLISPDHPVRKQITPSSYLQIYSRVVVQGTTPNLPINLADMIAILVTGWKSDNQWPPKLVPLDPLVGRRRKESERLNEAQSNDHRRSRSGSLYQGLKKVFRIGTEKDERPQVESIVLANG